NRGFDNIEAGLRMIGFNEAEVAGLMGENWLRFFEDNFKPREMC
ncbi:MAG: membrane dipeptidase, partial [Pseudomonadota bacterium]